MYGLQSDVSSGLTVVVTVLVVFGVVVEKTSDDGVAVKWSTENTMRKGRSNRRRPR